MSHPTARRAKRRRTLLATFVSASVALGIVGASASHHQADAAPNDGADLIVMKDAAHVKMENGKPVFDANGLPVALDSTADGPIGEFNVGDYVVYRINVLNRGRGVVNNINVFDSLPKQITYQNSWTRRCTTDFYFVVPTDHLWVRYGQSFDPNPDYSGELKLPCESSNTFGSYNYCGAMWNTGTGELAYLDYGTLYVLGRVNEKGAGEEISNNAIISNFKSENGKSSVDMWTANITVAPKAANAQYEPIVETEVCETPTPSPTPSTTTPTPSPSTSTTTPSPSPSTTSTTPSPSVSTTTTPTPSTSSPTPKTPLARTGAPLALFAGAALLTGSAGVYASRKRKLG